MNECCATGSCEVCDPAAFGFPIQRWYAQWHRTSAEQARRRGDRVAERSHLDRLAQLQEQFGKAVSNG